MRSLGSRASRTHPSSSVKHNYLVSFNAWTQTSITINALIKLIAYSLVIIIIGEIILKMATIQVILIHKITSKID